MAKTKKKKKPEKKLYCGRCRMTTPHLLLKKTYSNYIDNARMIQCKQCKEKSIIDVKELK